MIETTREWAIRQWATVKLGDERLSQRAVVIGMQMAMQSAASLPVQMQKPAPLKGAYRLLNHPGVSLEALTAPHRQQTLAVAQESGLVLFVEDTTELDFTAHGSTEGLGPIGDGRGRGLLLHSTLAVEPSLRQLLGLAHAQVVLREPRSKHPGKHWVRSPEGRVWDASAQTVGRAPAGVCWVHVSDAGGDVFEYLATCRGLGKEFLVRAHYDRRLAEVAGEPVDDLGLLAHVRSLEPQPDSAYTITVPAHRQQPERQAVIALQWCEVLVQAPTWAPKAIRERGPLRLSVVRCWEADPPPTVEAVEWVLLSSLPVQTLAEARQRVAWYTCRWLCEDYHQCLKTGCRIEHTQLDDGADIQRLLGFAIPIAVRLLQMRQQARQAPDAPASSHVDPLTLRILAHKTNQPAASMSMAQFWRLVARLGGHQGRKGDGPPGWRSLWHGWRYLSDLVDGARLVATLDST